MGHRLAAVIFLLVLTVLAREAGASQVHFRPLDTVIDERTHVFIATVIAVRERFDERETMRFYDIAQPTSLRGPVPSAGTALYTEIVPVMRGADGAVVGWFSPILQASGEEPNVKAGSKYVFLSHGTPRDGSLLVFRIEPMSNEAKVRALLAKLPEAGPAPPAAVTESKPAPSAAPSAPASSAPPARQPARSGCALALGVEDGETGARVAALVASVIAFRRRRRQTVATSDS